MGFGEPSERGGGAGGGVGFADFYFISYLLEMNSMDGMDVKSLHSSQSLLYYNQELADAEARIAQGDFISHEEVLHSLCTKKQSRN